MTYCVAVTTEKGLVFVSDSRTNAGVDNVSSYSKMHRFDSGADRRFVLLSAGNLATTQRVVQQLNRGNPAMYAVEPDDGGEHD